MLQRFTLISTKHVPCTSTPSLQHLSFFFRCAKRDGICSSYPWHFWRGAGAASTKLSDPWSLWSCMSWISLIFLLIILLHFLTCLRCPSPLSFHLVGFSSWQAVHTFIRSCSEIDSAFELPCWHKDNASMTLRAVQSKNQPCDWKQCWSNPKCKK